MEELTSCHFRCPVCATEFVADEIHGAVPRHRETDFRPVYTGADPVLINIHSCPKCRYSAYRTGFETERSSEEDAPEPHESHPLSLPASAVTMPDDDDVDDVRRYIRSGELTDGLLAPDQEPVGAHRYLLAARVREFLYDEPPIPRAHYYLRAAWAARATRDLQAERQALKHVTDRVNPVLEAADTGKPLRLRLSYLIGEISRRLGEFARAADLLSAVEHDADPEDPESAFLGALAQRQSTLASMKSAVNAQIPLDFPGWWNPTRAGTRAAEDDDDGGDSSLN